MADDSLFYYPGSESIYGVAGSTLAQSLPALVNPYASTGQNLAVTLGTGLVAALLGFKARQDANEAGIRTQELANAMLTAESPAARRSIIESAPGGFFEPNVQGRLLKLDTVLTENELKAQQAARQQQKTLEAQAQMQLSPLGQALNQQEIDLATKKKLAEYALEQDPTVLEVLNARAKREAMVRQASLVTPDIIAARQDARNAAELAKLQNPDYLQAVKNVATAKQAAADTAQREVGALPASLQTEVSRATGAIQAFENLAGIIENIKSTPEFIGATKLDALGPGIKQAFTNVTSQLTLARSGLAVTEAEAARIESMIKGDLSVVTPEQATDLLRRLARSEAERVSTVIKTARMPTSTLNSILDAYAQGGALDFNTQPSFSTPNAAKPIGTAQQATQTILDAEQRKEALRKKIAALKRERGIQ